jgi:hypothetical protein
MIKIEYFGQMITLELTDCKLDVDGIIHEIDGAL